MRIFDFAHVSEWESRLSELARMAEPERWNYLHAPSIKLHPILETYVKHTFERVFTQNRIAFTDSMACFNTGLLTPSQEEIFAAFTISNNYEPDKPTESNNKMWFLKAWLRSGESWLTKFGDLPLLASYWSDPAEVIFDPSLKVELNVDHIVRDNLNRFPVELGGKLDANGTPTDIDEKDDDDMDVKTPDPSSRAKEIPLAARNALKGAMEHSIQLAKRSYRIAVPQFHHAKIQLLLPLYLRNAQRADLALTLERVGNWYRAATVLYPDWAYEQARLLSRPNSEWLGGFRTDLHIGAPE